MTMPVWVMRERIDVQHVRHARAAAHEPVDARLVERGQREVGGGAATGIGLGAVPDDGAQFAGQFVRQPGHGLPVVYLAGVRPGELQSLGRDLPEDIEGVWPLRRAVHATGQPAVGRVQEAARRAGAVLSAQVVEADRRQVGQLVSGGGVQEEQRAVAEAAVRHGPQVLLDGLQHGAGVGGPRHVQGDGVHGGEPAGGPREVGVLEQFLAPVSLQGHRHPVLPGPAGQDPAERAQQDVVDAGAVRVRYVLEQPAGLLGVEADGHALLVGDGVRAAGTVRPAARRRHRRGRASR